MRSREVTWVVIRPRPSVSRTERGNVSDYNSALILIFLVLPCGLPCATRKKKINASLRVGAMTTGAGVIGATMGHWIVV